MVWEQEKTPVNDARGSNRMLTHYQINHKKSNDALYSFLKEGLDMHLPTKRIHIHNFCTVRLKWHKLRNKVRREIELAKVKFNAERVREKKTEPRKWHQRIKGMLNSTVSDLHMNISEIDSNNHMDMANAIKGYQN